MPAGDEERGDEPSRSERRAVPSDDQDALEEHRIARLEREVEELRNANEILLRVAGFLIRPRDRPQTGEDHD
ncbi:hypothetical protein CIK06_25610 [Plantactinospora sp. KBS50]|nr:hypothetical protein CIK06_25610 [Plantactinospora sp. KBS50]